MIKFKAIFCLLLFLSFLSCKTENPKKSDNKVTNSKYTLTPFTSSIDFPDAKLSDMQYKEGSFSFDVDGDLYALGNQTPDAPQKMCANSMKGQHIHLIVDNLPYAAKYVSDFEHVVEDGTHYTLAFLSRSYHESIKTKEAHIAEKVEVSNKSITSSEKIEEAMIFYSRLKGTYVGEDTKKVMLDFYLVNSDLSGGNYVEANINGETHKIEKWQPYYVEGLPKGENTITLSYFNSDGQIIKAPNNPVSRTFTLKADPDPTK